MTLHQSLRFVYEQPRSIVFEITLQGVLCQSGETPDMQTQSLESPSAPATRDYSW